MFKETIKNLHSFTVKLVALLCVSGFSESFAQNMAPPSGDSNQTESEPKNRFDSILSEAYRPKEGDGILTFTYVTASLTDAVVKTYSFSTQTTSKLASVTAVGSYLNLSYKYAIDENVNIGFSLNDALGKKIEYNYTASAKNSGYADFTSNRSGMEEPSIYLDYVLKRTDNLLVVLDLGFSPKTGDTSDTNSLRGGSVARFGFHIYRAAGKCEYTFGLGAETLSTRTGKSGTSTIESTGGNKLTGTLGVNLFLSEKTSLLLGGAYQRTAASTDTITPQTMKFENTDYGTSTISAVVGHTISKDLSMHLGASVVTTETQSSSTTTSKTTQELSYSYGLGLGLKLGF
tara:strand:+ start:6724 stop:7758 length:1035 start_codon:yes stop_codon:yes gene_type:complete